MTDEEFAKLASTFGFAPSRALRELLDAATAQAAAAEREACAQIADEVGDDDEDCHAWTAADAIRERGQSQAS